MSNNQTIKNLRVKNNETSISQVLPIGADAVNVELANRRNLQETIGNIDSRINGSITNNLEVLSSAIQTLDSIKADTAMIGSPLVARTASQMTDTSHIYVYTGNESGYTNGNWYYYDGTIWANGGVYNSTAVETDKTLKVENVAADSKAAGNMVLVSQTQPTAASNKIWIDPDAREIEIPTMDDVPSIEEFNELKDDLSEILGSETEVLTPLAYTQTGYYIALDGTTVDLNNPTASVFGHAYIVAPCSAGDEFLVNAKGGGKPRAWGFINSQDEIISVADASITVTDLRLTAPSGTTKLIINDNSSPNLTSYRIMTSHTGGIVVRYDINQNNTQEEKERARRNLGIESVSGLSNEAKEALLACFQHVAWIDEHGQSYYDVLYDALYTDTPTPAFDYGIYNPEAIVTGKYIDANGDIQTASGTFYIDDYIPVVRSNYWIGMNPSSLRVPSPGTAPTNESDWRISEYDASKNFIKQTHFEDTNDLCSSILYDFDSNIKYIRIGWSDSNSSTNSKAFDIENPAHITVCPVEVGNIDASTGANADSTTRVRTVGYIPVSNTISITGCPFYDSWSEWMSLWTSVGYSQDSFFYLIRCYDSNKSFLGTLTYEGSGTIKQNISNVALPEGTAYIRMLFQTENHAALAMTCINHLVTINGVKYFFEAVDFYDSYAFAYPGYSRSGILSGKQPDGGYTNDNGVYLSTNTYRATLYSKQGNLSISSSQSSRVNTTYFPIPVPADATTAKITMSPTTLYAYCSIIVPDSQKTTGYSRGVESGWIQSGSSMSFTASDNQFLAVGLKGNSAGSVSVSVNSITIEFE